MTRDITTAIVTRLKSDSAICAVVGTSPNQRIYRASLPISPTFPCATVHHISVSRAPSHQPFPRYATSRIQCSVYAASDLAADTLAELIADNLTTVRDTVLSSVPVIDITDGGARSDVDPVSGSFLYHRDFLVRHLA